MTLGTIVRRAQRVLTSLNQNCLESVGVGKFWGWLLVVSTLAFFLFIWSMFLRKDEPIYFETLTPLALPTDAHRPIGLSKVQLESRAPDSEGIDGRLYRHQLAFFPARQEDIGRIERIDLNFVTFTGPPVEAAIDLVLQGCLFTAADKVIRDNTSIAFFRDHTCKGFDKNATGLLTIETPYDAIIGVMGFGEKATELSGESSLIGYFVVSNGSDRLHPSGQIAMPWKIQQLSAIERLAYMWRAQDHWVWWGLGISCSFSMAAFCLFGFLFRFPKKRWSAALGIFCYVFGLCAGHALLTPPFQAPDEPGHFLGFSKISDSVELAEDALKLAQRGHFEEIKFRKNVSFTSASVLAPSEAGWAGHHGVVSYVDRSPFTQFLWDSLTGFQRSGRLAKADVALLLLRLFNCFFSAILCGLVVYALGGDRYNRTLLVAAAALFFAVPTLPFFAMHVSNYAYSTGFYAVAVMFLALWFSDRSLHLGSICILPIFVSIAGFAAVNMLPFLALFLLFAFFTVCLKKLRTGDFMWACFSVSLSLSLLCFIVLKMKPQAFDSFLAVLPAAYAKESLYFAVFTLTFLFGVIFAKIIDFVETSKNALNIARIYFSQIPFIILVAIAAASLIWGVPVLVNNEIADRLLGSDYGIAVLRVFLSTVFFGPPDGYLASTFWFGFGWLEASASDWVIKTFQLCLLASVFALVRSKTVMILSKFSCLLSFLFAFVLIFVLAHGYSEAANVHGRYLIGVYGFLLPICIVRTESWSLRSLKVLKPIVALLFLSLLGFVLNFQIERYFG